MKCWNDIKYELFYLMYLILAVWFYIGQNFGYTAGNGLHSFSEFTEQVLYQEPALIRVMLLPPLCIVVLLRIRYYFGEQFVIRQKNKKRIYFKLLWACSGEGLVFSVIFSGISFGIGKIYGWQDNIDAGKDAGKLFIMTFFIFLCMLVAAVSILWIMQSRIAALLLVCLFGFYDTVTHYNGLHFCIAACLMGIAFLTAEKREFYGEKYKNDSV